MVTYICILRGINVSGHRMIKMDALRQLFAGLGFINIQTYIQSGNVIFQSKNANLQKLETIIAEAILKKYNFDVPVLLKEAGELRQIIKSNPFIKDKQKDSAYLHVTFLSDNPDRDKFHNIKKEQYKPDEFQLIENNIYLYCPNGYGKSKLTNSFWETKLKVTATTRNWKTTNELLFIAEKIAQTL
jgi:uncharacterized protein (DUF1697 family)